MNISYNWLRDYLPFDLTPDEVAAALTSIGLETGSVETVQSVRGGLAGLVTGRVLTCTAHPNSDHLHLTTVDVGGDEPLKIVCGAPNVAAGQMVVLAVIGAKLYDGDKEFVIKKSKIRGEESFGMICAEDEIGVGASHDGIIVEPRRCNVALRRGPRLSRLPPATGHTRCAPTPIDRRLRHRRPVAGHRHRVR